MALADQAGSQAAAAPAAAKEGGLLDQIISNTRIAINSEEQQNARDILSEFVSQVSARHIKQSRDVASSIEQRIKEIDELLSTQLSAVMHAPEFQKLEGTWRGLHYLVKNTVTSPGLKIRMMNASKSDIMTDIRNSPTYDKTALFEKVYEEEFGQFGGSPYGLLIGDFQFGRSQEDVALLEKIAEVAAAAHAPFITGTDPNMFGLDSFTQLGRPSRIDKIFDQVTYAKWKGFRASENSRYVGLALPRVLARVPYGPETQKIEEFNFEERVDGKEHDKYSWMNAAYALGQRITESFYNYGWCAAIRGVDQGGGGVVRKLPVHTFSTDEGDIALKCPTEVAITDRRQNEIEISGFIPLIHCKNTDYAAFFAVPSANQPKKYFEPNANASAQLSSQLEHMLAVSRFAHYFKAIMRDKVGTFQSREDVQRFMNNWLNNYIIESDTASPETKAEKPLREGRVDVEEIRGKPGEYRAIAYLRPHSRLERLTAGLRLVAELKPAKKA